MKRNKPYYNKNTIINCIREGKIWIMPSAKENAKDDFGWNLADIKDALKKYLQKIVINQNKDTKIKNSGLTIIE